MWVRRAPRLQPMSRRKSTRAEAMLATAARTEYPPSTSAFATCPPTHVCAPVTKTMVSSPGVRPKCAATGGGTGQQKCCATEAGSYLRRIVSCVTQLKAQGPSRTCNNSKEEEEEGGRDSGPGHAHPDCGVPSKSTPENRIKHFKKGTSPPRQTQLNPVKRVCIAMRTCRPGGSTCPHCHTNPL